MSHKDVKRKFVSVHLTFASRRTIEERLKIANSSVCREVIKIKVERKVFLPSRPRAISIFSLHFPLLPHNTRQSSIKLLRLTLSICILRQLLTAFVHLLFTSPNFLLVCSSFMCMLSMRWRLLVPLGGWKEKQKEQKSNQRRWMSYEFLSRRCLFYRFSCFYVNSLNPAGEEFHFTLHLLDFTVETLCHRTFTAADDIIQFGLRKRMRMDEMQWNLISSLPKNLTWSRQSSLSSRMIWSLFALLSDANISSNFLGKEKKATLHGKKHSFAVHRSWLSNSLELLIECQLMLQIFIIKLLPLCHFGGGEICLNVLWCRRRCCSLFIVASHVVVELSASRWRWWQRSSLDERVEGWKKRGGKKSINSRAIDMIALVLCVFTPSLLEFFTACSANARLIA